MSASVPFQDAGSRFLALPVTDASGSVRFVTTLSRLVSGENGAFH